MTSIPDSANENLKAWKGNTDGVGTVGWMKRSGRIRLARFLRAYVHGGIDGFDPCPRSKIRVGKSFPFGDIFHLNINIRHVPGTTASNNSRLLPLNHAIHSRRRTSILPKYKLALGGKYPSRMTMIKPPFHRRDHMYVQTPSKIDRGSHGIDKIR